MFKEYLILLLLAHIIADFYIQTEKVAIKKDKSLKWLLIHGVSYFGMMILVALPIISFKIILGVTMAAIFHLLIDLIKFVYIAAINKKGKMSQVIERNLFFTDQFFHFICLIGVAYWLAKSNISINEWGLITDILDIVGVSGFVIVSWTFALLLIHKPANIVIQKLLSIYKPVSNNSDMKEVNNAGRFIGTVERIIMLIFLSIEQYSAIGLVLTAKSIARYDKISKEKDFAEYYLLGTLISTLFVIVVSFVL
ncbi:DUF3307 domain-containing protein [Sedimentibacter sp. MB31-C6]|uniref:DUF3307 domain-containing protein n=1 Tax=Sedimentibacter sp. MB31-C6 TaxID=3109366 RepID=UPI002DDCB64F|nr:DUF3307 domain-containing protein [Sedimentibacter sp. MB36-C1]WSI04605.1 DUF3307 domain-containing protein [Sedimentibacter sp. MB36-C1]